MRRASAFGLIGLLGIVPAAAAQTPPPSGQAPAGAPAAAAPAQEGTPAEPRIGYLDFGVRGSSIEGDAARYQRYRDLSDGVYLETLRWHRQPRGWFIDAAIDHLGRDDQRYAAEFVRPGKLEGWAVWDQIPMRMSFTTQTLFVADQPSVLTINEDLQRQVQASLGSLPTVFATNARTFDLESRRHIARGGVRYLPSPEMTLHATFQRTNRQGEIPFGGSFGHSSLVETPAPVNHTTVDVDAGAEFERGWLLARGGYTGSFFRNDVTSLEFDNPFRALPDVSGTSSHGRLALAPSNSYVTFNGMASVGMPRRTRATASLAVGSLQSTSDSTILPHTVNAALPSVPLPRSTLDGDARTTAVNLTLTSRPVRLMDINVRYRSYDYDNRTPEFVISQRVAYDNAVSTLATPKSTEPHSVLRRTIDADARFTPIAGTTAGVGYSRVFEERTHRIFESTTEDILRVTFDLPSQQWFSLRTKYEHGKKRGQGDDAHIAAELLAVGEQPAMRHFDIASRDRNRVTILGSAFPTATLSLTMSAAFGQDDYLESRFGLGDNSHQVYSVGLDAIPTDRVGYGGSYEYERYNALSRSRQASSASEFVNPSRDWATDATDRAHSIVFNVGVQKLKEKVDVNLSYNFSRARSLYHYIAGQVPDRTLPEVPDVPTSLPPPSQLPPVKSDLQRAMLDLTYPLGPRLAVGLSYWYEDYKVEDFTLDMQAQPELGRSQVLLLGYLYQPYTAHTVWGRILYRW